MPLAPKAMKIGKYQISRRLSSVCMCVCASFVWRGREWTPLRSTILTLFLTHFISLPGTHTHRRKYTHYWTHTHTQCNLQRGPATFCGINWRRGFYHKAISYYVDAFYAFPALVSPSCCCCQSFMAPALYHKASKAFALRPDQTRPTAQS